MARSKTIFECTNCANQAPKWVGRCHGCGQWNTLIESIVGGPAPTASSLNAAMSRDARARFAVPLNQLDQTTCRPDPTGVSEFDRVLGGGVVTSSISLLGGEPGVGKSTLLAQVATGWASKHGTTLVVSAEESAAQVSTRFKRLSLGDAPIYVGSQCDINAVLADVARLKPTLVIIDSIQTVFDPEIGSAPGSVVQVRQCAHRLTLAAREHNAAIVLVGQVTKDGSLAGPRVLEDLVDTVLSFEGERDLGLRMLRALKHRFGPTGELGVFEMTGSGLVTVEDPSNRLLGDRLHDVAGSAVAVTIEGRRAVVLEVQGLAVKAHIPTPRRFVQGFDQKRLSMLLAVLDRGLSLGTASRDVYLSVVGGLRISEPGADLAVCAAVASSLLDIALPPETVAIAEVGLAGELRAVSSIERRLSEAARLGFKHAVIADSDAQVESPIRVSPARDLAQALQVLAINRSRPQAVVGMG